MEAAITNYFISHYLNHLNYCGPQLAKILNEGLVIYDLQVSSQLENHIGVCVVAFTLGVVLAAIVIKSEAWGLVIVVDVKNVC